MTPLSITSNWRNALLAQLSCACGISNRANASPLITIEDNGLALCQCGKRGNLQDFLPKGIDTGATCLPR